MSVCLYGPFLHSRHAAIHACYKCAVSNLLKPISISGCTHQGSRCPECGPLSLRQKLARTHFHTYHGRAHKWPRQRTHLLKQFSHASSPASYLPRGCNKRFHFFYLSKPVQTSKRL
ncbi:hypothetical protein GALMADRAFT_262463, partial [Galerina marginata CBS 339.88]